MGIDLGLPVSSLKYISANYTALLGKLGIFTIRDLLTHFPRYHSDHSHQTKISDIQVAGKYNLRGDISGFKNIYTRSRKQIQQATINDGTGTLSIIWFNQPFLSRVFKNNTDFLLSGQVNIENGKATLVNPDYEAYREHSIHLGRIAPIYALTTGVTAKWLRRRLLELVEVIRPQDLVSSIDDLTSTQLYQAVKNIHFPLELSEMQIAEKRLALEELVAIFMRVQQIKQTEKKYSGIAMQSKSLLPQFLQGLTFTLTADQTQTITEILADLAKPNPMNRLVQGDVGSGKTVVAIAAALVAAESGYQTAMLAPTLILAEQHYNTMTNLLANTGIKVQLVTGATKDSNNDAHIYIGTSAILARKHKLFNRLGLVIADEQHRFGVKQRQMLKEMLQVETSTMPHLLDMTATPIPRTIALTFFDDMDLSSIRTKPQGRLPINTRLIPQAKRAASCEWMKEQAQSGHQIYWVCSLVEEDETKEVKSAKATFTHLQTEVFPDLRVGLIHGKLSDSEKTEVMQAFKEQQLDILVATTVIEVGVDVPNATVMVIEDADRLGLAQLHQIRGRVGRGSVQSWCFIFESADITPAGEERLAFFASHNDGLEIAEYDLQQRGPGEVYGTRQAGIPNLKIAKLNDIAQLREAKEIASRLATMPDVVLPLFFP